MTRRVDIAVVVGSAVPAALREAGLHICWVGLLNGEHSGAIFQRRSDAEEWRLGYLSRRVGHDDALTGEGNGPP